MRLQLKMKLLQTFGSQARAAEELGIDEKRLSDFVRARAMPRPEEQQALQKHLGVKQLDHLLRITQ